MLLRVSIYLVYGTKLTDSKVGTQISELFADWMMDESQMKNDITKPKNILLSLSPFL